MNGETFTPLACSVLGTLGPEAEHVLLRLSSKLTKKGENPRAAEHHLRMRIQAAVIKATSQCLRRSRKSETTKTREQATEEGVEGTEAQPEAETESEVDPEDYQGLQQDLGMPFED